MYTPSYRFSLLFFVLAFFSSTSSYSIHFQKDSNWETLLQLAQSQKKLLFVDAFTTWCGPCKVMEREVFPDSALSAYFDAHYISVQINMETPQGRAFAQTYPVEAYPSLLFIAPDGRLLKMNVGAVSISKLQAIGRYVQDPESTPLPVLRKRFEAGEREQGFIAEYMEALTAVGEREPMATELFLLHLSIDTLTTRQDFIELWYEHPFTLSSPLGVAFSTHFDHFLTHFETYAYQKLTTLIEEQLTVCMEKNDKACIEQVRRYVQETVHNEAARRQVEAYMKILIGDKYDD